MSAVNREGGVTLLWEIENVDELIVSRLSSPVFLSKSLDYTEWMLTLDTKVADSISIALTRCCSTNQEDNDRIILDCEMSIINTDGLPLKSLIVKNHGFVINHTWLPSINFVSKNEVFRDRFSEYIPFNILNIRCRMWRRFDQITYSELLWNTTKIERDVFVWKIENFPGLRTNEKIIMHPFSENPFLTCQFHLNDSKGPPVIEIISEDSSNIEIFCAISLLDHTGKIWTIAECSGPWVEEFRRQVWQFPLYFTSSNLLMRKDLFLPMNILSLRVECFFWYINVTNPNDSHIPIQNLQVSENIPSPQSCFNQRKTDTALAIQTHDKGSMTEGDLRLSKCDKESMTETEITKSCICKTPESMLKKEPCKVTASTHTHASLVKDLRCVYDERLLCDFTLRVGNRTFDVHKVILSARSPVFKAMFTTPLQEKEGRTLDIPDIDADALHRMLLFVYSNQMEDQLGWEDAVNLYFAADKYNIEELKSLTCSILKSKLSVENVCETLIHADLHEDEELKRSATEFVARHDDEIIGSEVWKKFQRKHMPLAMEVLSVLYTKVKKRIE